MAPQIESLVREECLRLLGTAAVGRIGVSSAALPVILPVNFVVFDDGIVFRTAAGTKLAAAAAGTVVAFEVDDYASDGRSGWSVLVQGVARTLDTPEERAGVDGTALESWAVGADADHLVRIDPQVVTGRRFSR
ncbi:MAG TPA: pyridoxamine 5'-phosphate oxidase family protein [Acidimicrobiales bacterium]|nr:pyridoxamine 5'-phosphate oxidase family protein [Acidimicrobiales bacterium]